jgi:protein TonB
MFSQTESRPKNRYVVYGSVVLHCLLLGWLVHEPVAKFLAPTSVIAGNYGTRVTPLYFPAPVAANDSERLRSVAADKPRLTLPSRLRVERARAKAAEQPKPAAVAADKTADQGPPAGSPYGSLYGALDGHEIRPALPVYSFDPIVSETELPNGVEGNVIVEITIDDKGNVVERSVVQSLSPNVDSKVLAAVEKWHFRPATRDGVAIASKQDVYYHFPTPEMQQYRR